MKKIEEARASIALALLGLSTGATLPRTLDLARSARVGNGTVQGALESLEADGAITTSAHGSLGRRLIASDAASLWKHSGRGALTGVLPLPESREFAGLATGISAESDSAGIPLQLLFRQGNLVRIEQLVAGVVDFSVMSRRAVETSAATLSWLPMGAFTFYSRNAVVVIAAREAGVNPSMRVAIDRGSSDHVALTLREFPNSTLVDMPYLFIPEAVANGQVDAAVWHRTTSSPLMTATGLSLHELSNTYGDSDALSEAVMAWRADDQGVERLIKSLISPLQVRSIQKEVMDGVRVPQF